MHTTIASSIIAAIFLAATHSAQAAELSASQVSKMVGVPIAKVETERSKFTPPVITRTYYSTKGDAVIIISNGPTVYWEQTRAAMAPTSKPFAGVPQAYKDEMLQGACAPSPTGYACVSPSVHYPSTKTTLSDDVLRKVLKAAL
jgi:hypothetical protein